MWWCEESLAGDSSVRVSLTPAPLLCRYYTHLLAKTSILIIQPEGRFCVCKIPSAKRIFRPCDAAEVLQVTELSLRVVFSYFLYLERIDTDHTFC